MNKGYLKSKTLWVSILTALLPLFPEAEALVSENPKAIMTLVGAVFGLLRLVTHKKLGN